MRLNYSDDEDFPGQFNLWQANCDRSLRGKAGQKALAELEAALVALPEKALHREVFVEPSGAVCALGALQVHRLMAEGKTRREAIDACIDLDPEDSQAHGRRLGFPSLAAWKVVEQNDIINERNFFAYCEGPRQWGTAIDYTAGYGAYFDMTPEIRYQRVLAFVRELLQGRSGAVHE